MSAMTSTAERLRRATQLWHAYLASTGQRFDLAQFLKDPAVERQAIDSALASGDPKLIGLAQDWLLGTGQALPSAMASRIAQTPAPAPSGTAPDAPKPPARYLRGVR
jgi:hypothetical protein